MATSIDDNAAEEQAGKSISQKLMIRCTSLASKAIALKTLFERRARVCLKSNP